MPGIHYTHALMLFRSTSISWIGYECRVHNLTIIMKVLITYQWQFFPFQYLTFTKRYFNNFWKLLFTIELVGNSILRLRRVSWEYLSQGEKGEGGFSGKGWLLGISFSLDSTPLSPIWMSDLCEMFLHHKGFCRFPVSRHFSYSVTPLPYSRSFGTPCLKRFCSNKGTCRAVPRVSDILNQRSFVLKQ